MSKMTNEELITKLLKENLDLQKNLKECKISACEIIGILCCIGGGLNDNIKKYNKTQMKDLFLIKHLAETIL